MRSTTMFQSLNKKQSLPLQQPGPENEQPSAIRRRLSSASLKAMSEYSAPATEWAMRRSKSMSAMGETAGTSIAKWWESSWEWILSSKLPLDLHMTEQERLAIGCQNKGSWRHAFYKISTEIKRIVGADKQTFFKTFDRGNVIPH